MQCHRHWHARGGSMGLGRELCYQEINSVRKKLWVVGKRWLFKDMEDR